MWMICAAVAGMAGCGARALHQDGMAALAQGRTEEGLAQLNKAAQADPGHAGYRKDFLVQQMAALNQLLLAARAQAAQGNAEAAEEGFRKVLAIDPANTQAGEGLARLRRERQHGELLTAARRAAGAGEGERALPLLNAILAEDSTHSGARNLKREIETPLLSGQLQEASLREGYAKPINLEFRDASVRMALEALSRTSGINFIFDKDVPADLRTTVFLRNAGIDEAVDLILRNSQLRRKILNSTTVQVYPDTPEKRRDYQELMVRAFYLQDATAAQMQTVLKTLLRMKDIVIDERLNLLTVRDTPEAVRLAEKLVALHDLAEPEVMLEIEVIDVQRDDLLKLGIQWPNQLTVVPIPSGANLTLHDLRTMDSRRVGVNFSNPSLSARQDTGSSNLLANPRIRVHNREKASVMIGDKLPIVTTTSTATGFVAENVQYLDVGLKVGVEPLIHASGEVSLRLNLEVSSVSGRVETPNGTTAYQVGTRNANTFLRLKDGETQVLAGLISDQDRKSTTGVPGLSQLPLLGRLFSAPQDSHTKTEIVLSITPRIVRGAQRPESQPLEFWSGTENGLSTRPLRLSSDKQGKEAKPLQNVEFAPPAGALPATAGVPEQPLQLVWGGPNQVNVGQEFQLSLRMRAPENAQVQPMQILYDPAVLEVSEVQQGELAAGEGGAAAGVVFDSGSKRVKVDLSKRKQPGASLDGNVLTLRMKALAANSGTELKIVNAGGSEPATPYTVRVAQ
ncbi:secretin N-terminal domain-containing protein [Massilia sp. NR 4-1]|uniref:secretin N-terminal domain-containing protein n=1 Tax=Massilia sp. NR 4-1 TaxID=1678028 RepID=UPI0012378136|nr:secretin N-terminal domain-containing protein [Massilia sp. NR 4-1]